MLGRIVAIPAPPLVSRLALVYLCVRNVPRSSYLFEPART
jgi:hypothetical protein